MRAAILSLLLLTACGYHCGTGALASKYDSISIPYVKGDSEGVMTAALVEKISTQSMLRYSNCDGDLELKVCLDDPKSQNIGFRYAPTEKPIVVANEGRLTQVATVTVIDSERRCTVLGPFKVTAVYDYDFQSDMGISNLQNFSLGQIEMNSIAKGVAKPPLYNLLAEKIVDYVNNSW